MNQRHHDALGAVGKPTDEQNHWKRQISSDLKTNPSRVRDGQASHLCVNKYTTKKAEVKTNR